MTKSGHVHGIHAFGLRVHEKFLPTHFTSIYNTPIWTFLVICKGFQEFFVNLGFKFGAFLWGVWGCLSLSFLGSRVYLTPWTLNEVIEEQFVFAGDMAAIMVVRAFPPSDSWKT